MKKHTLFTLACLLLLFLGACSGEITPLHFDSPEGDRSIDVTGERQGLAGPIVARVTLNTPRKSDSFSFEHQASSLTAENCTATWKNNAHAVLNFTLDDGEGWEVECFLTDDQLKAVKKFKLNGKGIFH